MAPLAPPGYAYDRKRAGLTLLAGIAMTFQPLATLTNVVTSGLMHEKLIRRIAVDSSAENRPVS